VSKACQSNRLGDSVTIFVSIDDLARRNSMHDLNLLLNGLALDALYYLATLYTAASVTMFALVFAALLIVTLSPQLNQTGPQ
jgi:hypothetical protein